MTEADRQAHEDWERTKEFWAGKCRYCRVGVELVMAEVGVSRTEAVGLWAAMMNANAADSFRVGVADWIGAQDKTRPLAERAVHAMEEEIKRDTPEAW